MNTKYFCTVIDATTKTYIIRLYLILFLDLFLQILQIQIFVFYYFFKLFFIFIFGLQLSISQKQNLTCKSFLKDECIFSLSTIWLNVTIMSRVLNIIFSARCCSTRKESVGFQPPTFFHLLSSFCSIAAAISCCPEKPCVCINIKAQMAPATHKSSDKKSQDLRIMKMITAALQAPVSRAFTISHFYS